MLNVLLNTHSLLDYHRTGIPYYTWHLFNGMMRCPEIDLLYAFTDHRLTKYRPGENQIQLSRLSAFCYRLEKNFFLKKFISLFNPDSFEKFSKKKVSEKFIYLEPNFILKNFHGSCITTLHDLTCLRFPELQPAATVAWFMAGLERTLKQAKHIIAVSDFTRNEAIKYLGISPDKISKVYNGVSNVFRPRTETELQPLLKKYKLNFKKFILSVSTLEPRKNLPSLINGYLQLPSKIKQQYPLILVGATGWKIQDWLNRIKQTAKEDVHLLGYIPQDDLAPLFSAAKAFCYLSTYEGFGLPVLEALASGTPVLTSSESAMAEFSHKQAFLVNPLDTSKIHEAINHLIQDETYGEKALSLADYYRENFSWQKCVADTLAIIKKNTINGIN